MLLSHGAWLNALEHHLLLQSVYVTWVFQCATACAMCVHPSCSAGLWSNFVVHAADVVGCNEPLGMFSQHTGCLIRSNVETISCKGSQLATFVAGGFRTLCTKK